MEKVKKILPRLALTATLITLSLVFSASYAQAQEPGISTEHRDYIAANCQPVKSTLARLHTNDGPTYVNRNQTYFSISDKLISRFNGRLALSSYDMTQFSRLARDYNAALSSFRIAFGKYDDTMKALLKIDCSKQPEQFYTAVAAAREQRGQLHEAVARINTMITQYGQAVTALDEQLKEDADERRS